MILVDTGPLVAFSIPRLRSRCRETLQGIQEPPYATVPALTEVFDAFDLQHSLQSIAGILKGGLSLWFLDNQAVERASS